MSKRMVHKSLGTLVTLFYAIPAYAQTIPDMFGQSARTLDQFRLQQSVGILAMVVFSLIGGVALAMRSLKIGFGCLFIALGTYVWYSDIGRSMVATTGTPIAP